MFRGINSITIDNKGRFAVPTRYRDALGASLVITIDTEETCLLMYPMQHWQTIEDQLQKLPSYNEAARRVQRLLLGHATDVDVDGNGRLLLPPLLRSYAKLDKHGVMIGQGNKFEIWDEAHWQSRRDTWLKQDDQNLKNLPDEMRLLSL